jgi:YD repeat-containing protein
VYTVVALETSRRPAAGPFGLVLLQTTNACGSAVPQGQTAGAVVNATKPFHSYSIPAGAGDSLVVRTASFTPGFSAQMDLYDPAGARLDSATFGISRRAATGGTYTVIVGAAAPRTGGGYSLAWQKLNSPAATAPLACGASTTSSLTASSQFRFYTANAAAGDVMRLIFTRVTDNFSPQMELFDTRGTRLTSTSDITQRAADDGDYLVMVGPSSSNGETGTYNVAYQRANRVCSQVGLTCGQTTLRMVGQAGQLDAFTFTGNGGDQMNLRLTQRSGAYFPFVELYDGGGTRIGSSSNGLLRPALPATGTYALLVRDRDAINTGSYRVTLQNEASACAVDDGERPVVSLLQPTGGEVIAGGGSYQIAWQSDDNVGVNSQEVAISTDGGQTFPTVLAASLGGNAQAYNWLVPPDIVPSRTAVLRVTATDAAGNAQTAASGPVSIIGAGFPANTTATFKYDGLDRIIEAAMNEGRTIQYFWDEAGNLVEIRVQ